MKRINVILLMLVFSVFTYGQKASISVSHTVTYDLINVLPDSIKVENLTQGGDTTLYGADTTLLLNYFSTGLNGNHIGSNDLVLLPNYPNPFLKQTFFNVFVREYGQVIINVYDISGKEITNLSANYPAGNHKFSFRAGKEGLYVLNVTYNNKTFSIKMYSLGGNINQGYEINYLGEESLVSTNKSIDAINSFSYNFGDQLKSIVYYQLMADTTIFTPTQDTLIQIVLLSPAFCPASFTDIRDSTVYSTVLVGTQCWMGKNLAYLPSVSPSYLGSDTIPYYYVYDYEGADVSAAKVTSNYYTYGVLYNWPAAMDSSASSNSVPSGVQGVCPAGWHLPSDEEWKILEGEVDSQYGYPDSEWNGTGWRGTDAGGNLKEASTGLWYPPNTGATNLSNFTAMAAGSRVYISLVSMAVFAGRNIRTFYWSSTEAYSGSAYCRTLDTDYAEINRYDNTTQDGFSLRCLKD